MTTMEFRDGSTSVVGIDDDLVIYDRENSQAWIQSDIAVDRGDVL